MRRCADAKPGLSALAALLCAACLPPTVDPLGHPCDEAHLCPSPLVCVSGWCANGNTGGPDGGGTDSGNSDGGQGRSNILADGDFEFGPTAAIQYWHGDSLQIETARVRTGTYAAQLSGSSTVKLATIPYESISIPPLTGAGTYCAQAWVTSELGAVPVLQFVRLADDLSQISSPASPSSTTTLDGGAGWYSLVTSITRPATDLALDLTVTAPLDPNGSLFVDDASVWLSTDGTCTP
jgi:hypothetical protein